MGFKSKVKSTSNLGNFLAKVKTLDKKEATAGFDDKIHPDTKISYAYLAAIHEFGTDDGHVPRREFMTQAFNYLLADSDDLADCVINVLYGKSSANTELKKIAKDMAEHITQAIERGEFADLSPITIRLKGDNIPLQESGRLLSNIRAIVRNKEED